MKSFQCRTCEEEKDLTKENFGKDKRSKTGFRSQCKACVKKKNAEWRANNPDYHKKWREDNPDYLKKWAEDNPNYHKKWTEDNPDYGRDYQEKRRREMGIQPKTLLTEEEKLFRRRKYGREYARKKRKDPIYRMKNNMRALTWLALKREGGSKAGESLFENLPYSVEQLKEHLEAQFNEHMTWDNYGSYWHVDHIHPQSLLPYDSFEHPNFQKCWALENLQPLEKIENIRKSNKVL